MDIYGWANEEYERIQSFLRWWRGQNSNDAMEFPLDMEPGEWDEQYRAWEE